jgi:hypothetical protein
MPTTYTEALVKDMKRLEAEMKALSAAAKKNPNDANTKGAIAKLKPFLTPESLAKRFDHAQKLDIESTKKAIKDCGFF